MMTRHDAIKHLAHKIILCKTTGESWADCVNVDALEMATIALQKQEPERKKGNWLPYLKEGLKWKCSECGSRFTTPFHFCPHCGAEMEEE